MRTIPVISVDSLKDALDKLDLIIDTYKTTGVLKLQGHSFSPKEQVRLVASLGDVFGWHINSLHIAEPVSQEKIDEYVFVGGHSDDPNRPETLSTGYLLDWHIEQVFYVNTFLAGFWNMFHIGYTDPLAGNTYFVDSNELYEGLTKEDREFLSRAVVIWDKPIGPNRGFGPFYTKAIDNSPVDGRFIVRIETDNGCIIPPTLHKLGEEDPSEEDKERFQSILSSLKSKLLNNEDIRYVQQWQEGDLIIVDLFRMYHAVTGGFNYGERKFHGTFTRPLDYTNDLFDSMEKVWQKN